MPTRLIIIIITLAVAAAMGFFLVWPEYQTLRQYQTEVEQKKAEFDSKAGYYSRIKEIWGKLEKYQDSLLRIESSISKSYSLPSIFNYLQSLSGQTGLVLEELAFGGVSGQDIKEIIFNLSVSGSYGSLQNFLSALESSTRLFSVKNVSFSSPEDSGIFSFDIVVATYSY